MKVFTKRSLKWWIPLGIMVVIGLFRFLPAWAEGYSRLFYPLIATVLSAISACFPFSLGDVCIVGAVLWVVFYPLYTWWKKKEIKQTIGKMVRFLMWIYIWFYFAWGMNYFRLPFYERTGVEKVGYSSVEFQRFLEQYIVALNNSYDSLSRGKETDWYTTRFFNEKTDRYGKALKREIEGRYREIAGRFGLASPGKFLYPKPMLWSAGMSRVGVTGYMGPFWAEFNLNKELLNVEYPFTYAHELAHRLGIAGEAEANLYAALVTCYSQIPEIRFSGYFSLLGYVMNNARRLLPEEDYKVFAGQIRPEIIEIYRKHLFYWREKYAPAVGKVQNRVYNAYLRSNKIESGTKNYSEVIGLLMSVWQAS